MTTVQTARTMAAVWVLVTTTLLTLHRATAAPIVDAPWGRIRGLDSVSVSGLNYSSYLAIPFALPPVGELRFAKPVAHPGYGVGQVFSATSLGYQCLQLPGFRSGDVGLSEDCLTLNVYVPKSTSDGLKHVMVWIHGGGFTLGGAPSYTPSELVTDHDVIVVVIQYRLDVMGFMSTGDDLVPGNMGLLDQNLALQWVKTNIGAFGGDPESMTVFGESAGAASVGYQVISPKSKGMKFRAIMQSGSPLAQWAINKNPRQAFYTLARKTGCLTELTCSRTNSLLCFFSAESRKREERRMALACLRGLNATRLIRQTFPEEGDYELGGVTTWAPVVDGVFVPKNPFELLSDVAYLDYVGALDRDVLLGFNNEEGAVFLMADAYLDLPGIGYTEEQKQIIRDYMTIGPALERNLLAGQLIFRYGLDKEKDAQRLDTMVNVMDFYYTQWSGDGARNVSKQEVANTASDINIVVNAVQFLRDLAKAKAELSGYRWPQGRHYMYLFNHYPTYKAGQPEYKGTFHAEELGFEFDPKPENGGRYYFGNDDYTIASAFRTMVATFAKTGQSPVPLLTNQTSQASVWPEFTLSQQKYLSLELAPRVDSYVYGKRVALWTELIPSLYNSTRAPEPTQLWTRQQRPQKQQQEQKLKWNRKSRAFLKMFNDIVDTFNFK